MSKIYKTFLIFIISSICCILIFFLNLIIVRWFGVWHQEFLIREILLIVIAFITNFLIRFIVESRYKYPLKNLISLKITSRLYLFLTLFMLLLSLITYILMLRNGSFSSEKILSTVRVFLSIAAYSVGSYLATIQPNKSGK